MPQGLLDELHTNEIQDLIAYVMDGGESHSNNDTSTAIGLSTSKPKTQTKKRISAKQISVKKSGFARMCYLS